MSESVSGEVKKFKERVGEITTHAEVDLACLDWLTRTLELESPLMRDVLQKNIEALRMGIS